MNGNPILSLPLDSYSEVPGRWELLNPKEMPLDRVMRRQCLQFETLSKEDQDWVRKSIGSSTEDSLWEFASRSAIFALRENDPSWIRAGVIAMSMLPNERDYRDEIPKLGLLRRACAKSNFDSKVFAEVAVIAPDRLASKMKAMVGPQQSTLGLNNFVETEFGLGYVDIDDGPYDRGGNLLSLAMKLAAKMEKIDPYYQANSFKIGSSRSPKYWFRSAVLDAQTLKKEVKSAVQFRAKIDPSIAECQRFIVDVYELKSAETVKRLQAAADAQGSVNNTAILAVGRGTLFCVIGSRTFITNGTTHESNDSLLRFQDAIKKMLSDGLDK